MKSPILFIIFKREDTTKRVFERIREAHPPKLYVAADGPRKGKQGEQEACERTRNIIKGVDWPCEVHTLFRDNNLGCGKGVSDAISWFFEHESEGIILEDDILPHIDFFSFCDEMLEKYRNDDSIHLISGHSLSLDRLKRNNSYYKSSDMMIWGWASWKRVWATYEFDTAKLNESQFLKKIQSRMPSNVCWHFKEAFKMMAAHKIDTWDFQFLFNQILYNRYSLTSYVNMTYNIGFGDGSTHTDGENKLEVNNIERSPYPIKENEPICIDEEADAILFKACGQTIDSYLDFIIKRCKPKVKPFFKKVGVYDFLKEAYHAVK